MGRRLRALVFTAILVGCGSPPARPIGFVNHTRHSDQNLMAIWKTAQSRLSQRIDLNAVQQSLYGQPPDILPGDPRALNVMPHSLEVSSEPDASSAELLAETGVDRPDPTGLIPCPQPCSVRYAPAYSWYQQHVVRYAASWETREDDFCALLEYEFETQILNQLGYDTQWR